MRAYFQNLLRKSLYHRAYSRAFYTLLGTSIQEIRVAFSQFFTLRYPLRSLLNLAGLLFSTCLRLLLGRSLKYSFAYTGEDRIIEGLLKPLLNKPGQYVDVGCNHPKFLSNTYGLYRKGWRGLCIDANPALIKKYSLYRPKDTAITAVVSDRVREVNFYYLENNVLSTLEPANVAQASKLNLSHRTARRTTTTLTTILQQQGFSKTFDLLSIDAEEHDLEVLRSLDLSVYTPRLIVVEDESFSFKGYAENSFVTYLAARNYVLVGYVLKNAYFAHQEFLDATRE